MNTYIDRDGVTWHSFGTAVAQDLYADLVAAIHIAHAYQAKCERLERWKADATYVLNLWDDAFEAFATTGVDLGAKLGQRKSALMLEEVQRLQAENKRLRAELDRLELVS